MKIKIEKNIYVVDKYRVKRQAFVAGQEVDLNEYHAVLSTNAVVNPKDLPILPKANTRSLATKDLAIEPTDVVVRSEEVVKEVEAEVLTAEVQEPAKDVIEVVEKEIVTPKASKPKAKAKVKDA